MKKIQTHLGDFLTFDFAKNWPEKHKLEHQQSFAQTRAEDSRRSITRTSRKSQKQSFNAKTSTIGGKAAATAQQQRSCLICAQRSLHAHYGVDSCQACSIFFRRTLLRGRVYACRQLRKGNAALCPVIIGDYEKCYACRIDRCLLAGMAVFGLKFPEDHDFRKLVEVLESFMKRQQEREKINAENGVEPVPTQICLPRFSKLKCDSKKKRSVKKSIPSTSSASSPASSANFASVLQTNTNSTPFPSLFPSQPPASDVKRAPNRCQQSYWSQLLSMPLSRLYKQTEAETLFLGASLALSQQSFNR